MADFAGLPAPREATGADSAPRFPPWAAVALVAAGAAATIAWIAVIAWFLLRLLGAL